MKIAVVRSEPRVVARVGRRPKRALLLLTSAAAFAAVGVPAAYAADPPPSGSNTSTVAITPEVIRSITVSPTTSSFGHCVAVGGGAAIDTLSLGTGSCRLGTVDAENYVTVTNGPVAGQIKVNGADAVPATGTGPGWAIGQGRAANQFAESNYNKANGQGGVYLTKDPLCDPGFNGSPTASDCAAPANGASDESLQIDAPSSSTITASSLKITTTWTAVP